ncbi:MAG: hypothetical protein N2167_06010 [Flavobacteriales bacterium]|nr:hypothetical protein [Flavobacteriales bacterium]
MKKNRNLILLLFFLSITIAVIFSCSSNSDVNLVCNSSFENQNQPDLSCWKLMMDTLTYSDWYSTVVPPEGGQFSLKLAGSEGASFDPYAETYITDLSGNITLQISAFIQALYGGQPIYLSAYQHRNGSVIQSADQTDWAFNGWKKFSITETFQFELTDTLFIRITQTTGQNSSCLVDLVSVNMH